MTASEIKTQARKSLMGKWGKAALIMLVYAIITLVINMVLNFIPLLGGIANMIISVPIAFGFTATFIKLKRGEEVGYTDFLSTGFASFGKAWGVVGNTILKMILPVCLIIVFVIILAFSIGGSGIALMNGSSSSAGFGFIGFIAIIGYIASLIYASCKGLLYSLVNFILYDNPNMTGKEIVEESERLMKGSRCRMVWLQLSFIGWSILTAFTFGIGLLWLIPYMNVAMVCFYESLKGNVSNNTNEPITNNEEAKLN